MSNELTLEEQRDMVEQAIMKRERLNYGYQYPIAYRGGVTPYDNNDLGDKVYEHSGALLSAYIMGDDAEILRIMKSLCESEIESLIDLVYG